MKTEWNLDKLYHGLDDPQYKKDYKTCEELIENYNRVIADMPDVPGVKEAEQILGGKLEFVMPREWEE